MYIEYGKQAMHIFFSTGKKCIHEQCNNTWLHSLHDGHNTFINIILLDMMDNYENLTLKGLLTMRWIVHHTHARAKYILKVDENVEICRFSTKTFWRLMFSHEWFIIHLQRDEVELEINSEPRNVDLENCVLSHNIIVRYR